MITSWNSTYRLPVPLAESIGGYNSDTNTIWVIGGFNGTDIIDTCWTFNPSTGEFTEMHDSNKQKLIAASYTSKRDAIYFANYYQLFEFSMSPNNPKYSVESVLPSSHYALSPSITTDRENYLFLTGGRVNGSIVNTLSIYFIGPTGDNRWLDIEAPSMKYARYAHNCIARNDFLYIFGGYIDQDITTNTIEKLYIGDVDNIESMEWELLNNTLDSDIAFMRIAEVNGLIYIIGGFSETLNSSVQTVNVLDPITDQVIKGVSLPQSTFKPAIIVDGATNQIYIFGGHEDESTMSSLYTIQRSNTFPSNSDESLTWSELEIIIGAGILVTFCLIFIIGYRCYKIRRTEEGSVRLVDNNDEFGYGASGEREGISDYRMKVVVGAKFIDTASEDDQ